MSKKPFSRWPEYSDTEIASVVSVLRKGAVNYWTGNEGRLFETEFASYVGVDYAVAVSNGTVALELALRALDLVPGDEVIVTPRSFIASVSSVTLLGLIPIFADVDHESQNITSETISQKITSRTRAIICVHLAGWPCDMDPILELATEYRLAVIEDCAQAHGAKYKGCIVGSLGDIGCWSFCQDKIMSTGGEGGMVATNDELLMKRIWSYKDHGKSLDKMLVSSKRFRWLHDSFGSNYRLAEIQSSIGRHQLRLLDKWVESRNRNMDAILNVARAHRIFRTPRLFCEGCNPQSCAFREKCRHAGYKCYLFVNGSQYLRDRILDEINGYGVPCFSGSCPEIYREKAFDETKFRPSSALRVAEELGKTSLMFLCDQTISQHDLESMCHVIDRVGRRYSAKSFDGV